MKKKIAIRDIIFLQAIIMLYSVSSVMAKQASGKDLFHFMLFAALDVGILGIYAILWQQAIKKFELSIAYANRAMVVLWAMVWAVLIFGEKITWKNIVGLIFIIAGTIIINQREGEKDEN